MPEIKDPKRQSSLDEKKAKNQEISKAFNAKLTKLVGKSYKEIEPFLNKMREELKSV